jgi:hypothetical protein
MKRLWLLLFLLFFGCAPLLIKSGERDPSNKLYVKNGKTNLLFGFMIKEGEFYEGSTSLKKGKENFAWGWAITEGEFDKRGRLTYGKEIVNGKYGWEYFGEFKKGIYDGQGKLKANVGFSYKGEFKSGKINGNGVYTDKKGSHLTGKFLSKKGKISWIDAEGTMIEGKNKIIGRVINNKFEGNIKIIHQNGAIWEGVFNNSKPYNGKGTYIGDGIELDGKIKDGKPLGCMIYKNKYRSYIGEMRIKKNRFEMHGNGISVNKRGKLKSGVFKENILDKKEPVENVIEILKEKYPDFDDTKFDFILSENTK